MEAVYKHQPSHDLRIQQQTEKNTMKFFDWIKNAHKLMCMQKFNMEHFNEILITI